jgi:hypothetical protein
VAGVWITCCLLTPDKLAAQLYAETDNLIKIDIPDVPLSMLEISATGGTIKQTKDPYDSGNFSTYNERYKKGVSTYWIARPSWVLSEYGQRPEFVVAISVEINGKTKVLATKRYTLKTAFYIDVRKEVHIITPENLLNDDIMLINNNRGNIFNLIYYASNGKSVSPPEEHRNGLFSEKEKQALRDLKTGSKMYIKFQNYSKVIELIMGE